MNAVLALVGACRRLVLSLSAAAAAQTEEPDPLVGVWFGSQDLSRSLSGTLSLRNEDEQWRASLDGVAADLGGSSVATMGAEHAGTVQLAFDDRGQLRFDPARPAQTAFWIQPPLVTGGSVFATPIELSQQDGVWIGEVVPCPDTFTICLVIERAVDGSLQAFLRNPERNLGRRFGMLPVREQDATLVFGDEADPAMLGDVHLAPDGAVESIDVRFPFLGFSIPVQGVAAAQTVGVLPRTLGGSRGLQSPPLLEDGWPTDSAESHGLDVEDFEALVREVTQSPLSVDAPYVEAILVASEGTLVLEEYFHGFTREQTHDLRSAGKSLVSLLVGLAIDQGHIDSTAVRVRDLFGTNDTASRWDVSGVSEELNLQHLLTMSAGLDSDDSNPSAPGAEDSMQDQTQQPDWTQFGLNLPQLHPPGDRAVYSSVNLHLAAASVEWGSGTWLPQFAREHLTQPLGIQHFAWNLTPVGGGYGGGGSRFRARDLLKIGQMVLDDGLWDNVSIVSEEWIDASTQPLVGIHEEGDYGCAWWMKTYELDGERFDAVYASGNGGQLLILVPELELVVLILAANYGDYGTWRVFRDEWLPRYVLPAVL